MAYVYEHWRPDTDQCFYVGKGSGERANRFHPSARGPHHRNIILKLRRAGLRPEVKIIADGLTDGEALALEMQRIGLHGRENLANHTAGGDGLLDPDAETRAKMSAAAQKRLANPEFRDRHKAACRDAMARPDVAERTKAANLARRGRKAAPGVGEKISKALKGKPRPQSSELFRGERNPFYGKKHSPESIARAVEKRRGRVVTEETKARMKAAQQTRRAAEALLKPPPAPKEPKPRHRHTEETRAKMRIAAKARGVSEATRAAQKAAVTGKKRAPFKPETIDRMRVAAAAREAVRRARSSE
jgi:hypothetical protein